MDKKSIKIPDRVIIYKSELEYISRCILDYPNIETGGNLFGFYTSFQIPIIQYVLGPGKNSEHDSTHFRQDEIFFNKNADLLIKEHALNHIGTWHSHHQLNLDHPSPGDEKSMITGMKKDCIDSFLLVIGNNHKSSTSAKAYSFSLMDKDFQYIPWVVLDEVSPIRLQFDNKYSDIIHIPYNNTAIMDQVDSISLFGERAKKISFPRGYWLNNKKNIEELQIVLDYFKKSNYDYSLFRLEKDQTLKIIIKDVVDYEIFFPLDFPKNAPRIQYKGTAVQNIKWKKSNPISQMIINYFEMFLNNLKKEA